MDYIYYISIALALFYFFFREIKKEKKRLKWERQEKIERDISDLAEAIVLDWNNSWQRPNKINATIDSVVYIFKNGDTVSYYNGKLIHDTDKFKKQYSLGDLDKIKFVTIFDRIAEIVNERNKPKSKNAQKVNAYISPKMRRYEMLIENIKLRKENLSKIGKNHPDRKALENELRVAENKAASIKNNK